MFLEIWRASGTRYPELCRMSYNSPLKDASSSGTEDSITCVYPLLHLLEYQSTYGIEAPSSSSPTRWATAPWWVIVIWTVGLEWAGGWGGLKGLCPGTELLLLLTVQRKDKHLKRDYSETETRTSTEVFAPSKSAWAQRHLEVIRLNYRKPEDA